MYHWVTQGLKPFGSPTFCITKWCMLWNFLHYQVTQGWTFWITKVLYHWLVQGLKVFVPPSDTRFETFVSTRDLVPLSDTNFLPHWLKQGLKLCITKWCKVWIFLYHHVKQGLKLLYHKVTQGFLYHQLMQCLKTFCITEWCKVYLLVSPSV